MYMNLWVWFLKLIKIYISKLHFVKMKNVQKNCNSNLSRRFSCLGLKLLNFDKFLWKIISFWQTFIRFFIDNIRIKYDENKSLTTSIRVQLILIDGFCKVKKQIDEVKTFVTNYSTWNIFVWNKNCCESRIL